MTDKTFAELGLSKPLLDAVADLGYEAPSQIQALAIPRILQGEDIVGLSETGSGKTAAFTLPALQLIDLDIFRPQVLILSPTRELCVQVCEEVRKLGGGLDKMRATPVYGGAPIDRQIKSLRGAQMVVGTPGRLMDHLRRGTIQTNEIKLVILDEADRMLDMGFREDMEEILSQVPESRQTLFFSATMNRSVERLIDTFGSNPEKIEVSKRNQTVERIDQCYIEVRNRSKVEVLSRLLDMQAYRLAVVFCNTKRSVDEATEALLARGYTADRLHGDITQQMRERTIQRFREGKVELLIATDVAARGLDIDEVDIVFNYDLPQDPEDYVHRIGRTGRAGREGRAVSFVFGRDVYRLQNVERFTKSRIRRDKIPSQEEVEGRRADVVFEALKERLEDENGVPFLNYIDRLLEQGHAATDIAGTLFGMLRELSGREGEEIQEDRPDTGRYREDRGDRSRGRRDRGDRRERGERSYDREDRGDRRDRRDRGDRSYDRGDRGSRSFDKEQRRSEVKAGMSQVFIGVGGKMGVAPGEIAGMIYRECSITNGSLGKIRVFPKHCLVQVPEQEFSKVVKGLQGVKYRGKPFPVREDRDIH
ncbi:ATP-dependent RNA helicase DeaD [Rubritalea squalenifaciens DSM 18772]|uniref:RNA helicase n=1 Tax=Rubritalea squalenifaciens DSM 18772 TaxID=1123071 RepID=A0A1M6EU89_9BACT|nr:DEAD/DEAH box helicase [Rubritalea squalenifaciens]SHI88982.1 ATP-dependent RNA helicase DeaD [Rubritalea squalenifaciens DSM 18772]